MKANDKKRACVIYVPATAGMRAAARKDLEGAGYDVCEVLVSIDTAIAAKAGDGLLSEELATCVSGSDLCLFLLPEETSDDAGLEGAAGAADAAEKRIIGVFAGGRAVFPQVFDDNAELMVRNESPRLAEAIRGAPAWERPDGGRIPEREIKRVRCQ